MKLKIFYLNIVILLFFSVSYAQNNGPVVLTNESTPLTLSSGDDVTVYGSSGQNTIIVEAGAHVRCINFIGPNQIEMEEASSQFTVFRSGAMVYLSSSAGTLIKIPATQTTQKLQFAEVSADLVISGGDIILGDQIVDRTECGVDIGNNDIANMTGNQDFSIEDAQDADPLFGFRFGSSGSNLLPSSVDYSSKMPNVKSQGYTGSCTAWATAYYYKTYQEAVEEGWDINQNAYSPMYLFAMQCKKYTEPHNFIASSKIIQEYGCAKWNTLPFQDYNTGMESPLERDTYAATNISEAIHSEARQYRNGEITVLNSIGDVKNALTSGPVILGINKYKTFDQSPSPENNYMGYDPSNSNAGHAILCVGYDDSKFGTGAIKLINSWGSQWAINGYSWIRYTDYSNIVMCAMTIKDLPNPNNNDNYNQKPSPPTNVSASDNIGPYVDIVWSKSTTAFYYRIFRMQIGNSATYAEIATTFGNTYRDYPEPGVNFYYSVVAVNDMGESDHFASDTESKNYVDIGLAKGTILQKVKLSWTHNDYTDVSSHFKVYDIDPAAETMEIFVSENTSEGPWHSLGWISPDDFYITWGENSEYVGKRPFVKVIVSNSNAYSEASDPIQVAEVITGTITVANIQSLSGEYDAGNNHIYLNWSTNNENYQYFNIFRYKAASDVGNEWIFIGSTADTYYNDNVLPGVSYYYAVNAMYQGNSGEFAIMDDPVSIPISQPNLYLYQVNYKSGAITNPAHFDLTVWNTGDTAIYDYSVKIHVYDWSDGQYYTPFDVFYASDFAGSLQLPLQAGSEHTLSLSLDIPSAYADGHYYSWIVSVDYYDEIIEEYEDDNRLQCSDSWWSSNLNPKPNLKLNNVTYDYGIVTNPVHFDLEVWNDGSITIDDYKISISVYDWDEQESYFPFSDFNASDKAQFWQLPLASGYKHTLSFDLNIPSAYGDGHDYYWFVNIDPYDNIDESNEEDNYLWSDYTWTSSFIYLSSLSQSNLKIKVADSEAKNSITMPSFQKSYVEQLLMKVKGKTIPVKYTLSGRESVALSLDSAGSKTSNTRPFSKRAMNNELSKTTCISTTENKSESYIGPIRYKKPSFCIDRRK